MLSLCKRKYMLSIVCCLYLLHTCSLLVQAGAAISVDLSVVPSAAFALQRDILLVCLSDCAGTSLLEDTCAQRMRLEEGER